MPAKGERMRDQIVSNADELFYHHGYSDTAFARLADSVGIPKGNFYYYYKTKEALLADVISRRIVLIEQQLSGWDNKTRDPHKRLKLFVNMLRDNAGNLCRYGCPVGTINSELGKDYRVLQQQSKKLFDLYINWLQQQFATITSKAKAREFANHLMSMAQGASLLAHVYEDKTVIRKETKIMHEWLESVFK